MKWGEKEANERLAERIADEYDFNRRTIGVDVSLKEIVEAVREVKRDGT